MSSLGVIGGVILYFGLRWLFDIHAALLQSRGRHWFQLHVEGLFNIARAGTEWLVAGGMRRSLFWLLIAAMVLGAWPFLRGFTGLPAGAAGSQPLPLMGWVVWVVLIVGTLGTVAMHSKRLTALIVIGSVGLMVSLVFVYLSAPDLALTQILVEMVTVAMLMMALNYLPKQSPQQRSRFRRARDIGISVAAGGGIAALAYSMMVRPSQTVAGELLARSLPEAYGSNVVNVILVDFRGLDTFGEITVFGIAGLVVHALLRWARLRPGQVMPGPPVKLPIPAELTQLIFPLTLTIAVPVLIKYVLQGARTVEATFGFDYVRGIGLGLLLAAAGGIGSWLFGLPFLTSGHVDLHLPLIGYLPIASALVFDTGVYVVVFASALLMLSTMGTVKHRQQAYEEPY